MRAWLCIAFCLVAPSAFAEERETLSDFEQPGLAKQFTPVANIQLQRVKVADDAPEAGPSGMALSASATGRAAFFSAEGVLKKNLLNASAVELWIHRSPAADAGALAMEVQFLEADDKAKYWSKFNVAHSGWKKYSLPLRWFRWSDGRIPSWNSVDRWGVVFRDSADVQIDNIVLVRDDDVDAALPQVEDYELLAFPDAKPASTKRYHADGLTLLTNALELDADRLGEHLAKVQREVEADCGKLAPLAWPATMIVFNTRDEYQAFFPRLAAQYNAEIDVPKTDGYAALGVAASSFDKAKGELRPVYTHEFVHAALARHCGLPNRGEWLQEGMASMYQLKHHKQPGFDKIVRDGIAKGQYEPLEVLTNNERIALNRYWQAATLCDLLVRSEKYQGKLPLLLQKFRDSGNTQLAPHCKEVLGVDMDELEVDWIKWCSDYK